MECNHILLRANNVATLKKTTVVNIPMKVCAGASRGSRGFSLQAWEPPVGPGVGQFSFGRRVSRARFAPCGDSYTRGSTANTLLNEKAFALLTALLFVFAFPRCRLCYIDIKIIVLLIQIRLLLPFPFCCCRISLKLNYLLNRMPLQI